MRVMALESVRLLQTPTHGFPVTNLPELLETWLRTIHQTCSGGALTPAHEIVRGIRFRCSRFNLARVVARKVVEPTVTPVNITENSLPHESLRCALKRDCTRPESDFVQFWTVRRTPKPIADGKDSKAEQKRGDKPVRECRLQKLERSLPPGGSCTR
jgi:hypothetical protein